MKMPKLVLLHVGLLLLLLSAVSAFALRPEKVLLSFNIANGQFPDGLTMDASGDLWAVTAYGGSGSCDVGVAASGCGTVVEFTPVSGGWKSKDIYSFTGGSDGYDPVGNLTFDSQGNIYGVTSQGGTPTCGCGTVFKLTPVSGGWKHSVIYRFDSTKTHNDGMDPLAGVILDAAGNLYGTTPYGGNVCTACGVVYELSPAANGAWTETILYNFKGGAPFNSADDGMLSQAPLVFDAQGNLYGTTPWGGANTSSDCGSSPTGCGVVFELSPNGSGGWTESVIHSFDSGNGDGFHPTDGLVLDGDGNLYGTTAWGGRNTCADGSYCGAAFELAPASGGTWTETVLHSFSSSQGYGPAAGLIFDSAGNLYGTTEWGGLYNEGAAFELSPKSGGGWQTSTLHSFGNGTDGAMPDTVLVMDASGDLYGGTFIGGTDATGCVNYGAGCGTVFEIVP
ncbi:MAG: choice-of-anchor tandem repeat GloVer-containing protein [Candidatus Sulfotelmatobacter sp.]